MKTATITFRLSQEEKEKLEQKAQALDIPVSQLVRQFIKQSLEE